MRYLLMVSHGDFASGLHVAFGMLMGQREDVLNVAFKDGMGLPAFKEDVKKVIAPFTAEDEVIVMADLVGGSPLTTTMDAIAEHIGLANVRAVGGMNLPMAIAAMECEDETLDDTVDTMIECAVDQIKSFKLDLGDDDEEDL